MDTIKLVVTKNCNRSCSGCCNKDHDIDSLPIFDSDYFKKHKKEIKNIIITGGEPLLYQKKLSQLMINFLDYKDIKFILYTAYVKDYFKNIGILSFFDGITLTLHEQSDISDAMEFLFKIKQYNMKNKTFFLNVFEGIDLTEIHDILDNWKVRTGYKWIKDCPLPKNEILMRLPKFLEE